MATRNVEKRKKRRRRRKVKTKVKVIASVLLLVTALGTYTGVRIYQNKHAADPFGNINDQKLDDSDSFTITEGTAKFIVYDVGKGEAVLIKSGNIEALVDTGPADHADKLTEKLKNEIDGKLDYLILSGPGPGRTGGADAIASSFEIETCIMGELKDEEESLRKTLAGCSGITEGTNLSLDIGADATLSIIKPDVSSDDPRDRSLITYFTFGNAGFLILSDAGKEEISRAYGDVSALSVQVLSRYGAEEPNMAIPEGNYGVYSVASTVREAGFPTETLEDHLSGMLAATCDNGDLEFVTDGTGAELKKKEAPAEGGNGEAETGADPDAGS